MLIIISKMKEQIRRWWNKPADPWEFWLPNSGLLGAFIAAIILTVIIIIAASFISLVKIIGIKLSIIAVMLGFFLALFIGILIKRSN